MSLYALSLNPMYKQATSVIGVISDREILNEKSIKTTTTKIQINGSLMTLNQQQLTFSSRIGLLKKNPRASDVVLGSLQQ